MLRMVSRNPTLFVGCFLSWLFFLIGLLGSWAFSGVLLRWQEAAAWPEVSGKIISGGILYRTSMRGGRGARAEFKWNYDSNGTTREGKGYGIANIFTGDLAEVNETLAKYPAGARVMIRVNPADPADSVLAREPASALLVLFVPPLFVIIGLMGGFFTFTGWLGWYRPNTRNPLGRLMRAMLGAFLRPNVLMAFVITVFATVSSALVWWSIAKQNVIGFAIAAFMVWSVLHALRFQKKRSRQRR